MADMPRPNVLASAIKDPLRHWVLAARDGSAAALMPWDELLAEHRLAEIALRAMEEETRRLYDRAELNWGFWTGVAEFVDRFVHRSHRVKEERYLFPAIVELGDAAERKLVQEFQLQHLRAHDLTELVVQGVHEGDWEKVLRASMVYISGIRTHMKAEEDALAHTVSLAVAPAAVRSVQRGFAQVETEAFEGRTRKYFLNLVVAFSRHAEVIVPPALVP